MKNNILITLLFLSFNLFGQKPEVLQYFDTSAMKTSVLYQELPIFTLADFQTNNNNLFGYYQVYKGLQQSDFENRMPSLAVLKNKVSQVKNAGILPLSILLVDYETIKDEALKNGTVYQDELGFMHNTSTESSIYNQNSIFVSSALAIKHKGLEVNFILEKSAVYNLSDNEIASIKINFNDGLGFKNIVFDKIIPVIYKGAGEKHLDFEIILENGKIEKNTAILEVLYSNADRKSKFDADVITFTSSITPDLAVYGEEISYPGVGEYQIFYSTGAENELNKPLFIIDGFDPEDGRAIEGYTDIETGEYHMGIYDLLNYENESGETLNLGDMIREEGFDIIILNFPEYIRDEDDALVDGGSDFIERNAMLLVELINTINAEKVIVSASSAPLKLD